MPAFLPLSRLPRPSRWFRPRIAWGAEFLAAEVRLAAATAGPDEKISIVTTFRGSYAEAGAFARRRGLSLQGLEAGFCHLPCKVARLLGEEEEDFERALRRLRPPGLTAESLAAETFPAGGEAAHGSALALLRTEALDSFLQGLPAGLETLWELYFAPLSIGLHLYGSPSPSLKTLAFLLAEPGGCHVLFLHQGCFQGYVFWPRPPQESGDGPLDERGDPAEILTRELRKVLVFQSEVLLPDEPLKTVVLGRDWEDGALALALDSLGFPREEAPWPEPLRGVAPEFRVAGALALLRHREEAGLPGAPEAKGGNPGPGFAPGRAGKARRQRLWLGRAGKVAAISLAISTLLLLTAGVIAALAFGLGYEGREEAARHRADFTAWKALESEQRRTAAELAGLQSLLSRKSRLSASLQALAASLPPDTWLGGWIFEEGENRRALHKIQGFTLSEARIPEFLSRLEKKMGSARVRLKTTELLKAEEVERLTGLKANRRELVRFEVEVME